MKTALLAMTIGLAATLAAEENKPLIDQLSPIEVKTTWDKLNSIIVKAGGITEDDIERARLQGILEKLGNNARLIVRSNVNEIATGIGFKEEMLPRTIWYARLGDLSSDNISQFRDALRRQPKTNAVILDLRATTGAATYDDAADFCALFTGGGKTLFSLVGSTSNLAKSYAGEGDVLFNGILIVLINEETSGPAEAVVGALRQQAHALVIGRKTRGQALDYASIAVNERITLEVAVGRVVLPGQPADFLQNGIAPDLTVGSSLDDERTILVRSEKEGVSPFIFEIERPHMNEASLVAGRNPELDIYQARKAEKDQSNEPAPLLDRTLQRALDTATSLLVLQKANKK